MACPIPRLTCLPVALVRCRGRCSDWKAALSCAASAAVADGRRDVRGFAAAAAPRLTPAGGSPRTWTRSAWLWRQQKLSWSSSAAADGSCRGAARSSDAAAAGDSSPAPEDGHDDDAAEAASPWTDPKHCDADRDGDLEVYAGLLGAQIKLVKGFSLLTSVIGLSVQPVLFWHAQAPDTNLVVVAAAGAFFAFFTFVTPLLIHFVSKKYVTRLYYNINEDAYTAVTYNLFLRPKKLKFRLGDVDVPSLPGPFTTFKAKNTPLFVDGPEHFFVPYHYGKIMGYDKPINLRWEDGMTASEAAARRKKEERGRRI